jgi:hypothetical protein
MEQRDILHDVIVNHMEDLRLNGFCQWEHRPTGSEPVGCSNTAKAQLSEDGLHLCGKHARLARRWRSQGRELQLREWKRLEGSLPVVEVVEHE